jgi:hypothetical protein
MSLEGVMVVLIGRGVGADGVGTGVWDSLGTVRGSGTPSLCAPDFVMAAALVIFASELGEGLA